MLNKTPWWKYIVVALVMLCGMYYALPNIFGNDPGMTIRGVRGLSLDQGGLERVQGILNAAEIRPLSLIQDDRGIRVRFASSEDQLIARDAMARNLGDRYSSALTLLSGAPDWLLNSGAYPMYLGLDLRGGVHFLLEVDMETAIDNARERYEDDLRLVLREGKLRYRGLRITGAGAVEVTMRNADQRDEAMRLVERELGELDLERMKPDPTCFALTSASPRSRRFAGFPWNRT